LDEKATEEAEVTEEDREEEVGLLWRVVRREAVEGILVVAAPVEGGGKRGGTIATLQVPPPPKAPPPPHPLSFCYLEKKRIIPPTPHLPKSPPPLLTQGHQ
jgi:hypothetical protein